MAPPVIVETGISTGEILAPRCCFFNKPWSHYLQNRDTIYFVEMLKANEDEKHLSTSDRYYQLSPQSKNAKYFKRGIILPFKGIKTPLESFSFMVSFWNYTSKMSSVFLDYRVPAGGIGVGEMGQQSGKQSSEENDKQWRECLLFQVLGISQ